MTKQPRLKLPFRDNLRQALTDKGLPTNAAFVEREFNLRYQGEPITPHAVAKWLRGEATPSNDKILTLARWLEVEPGWLLFDGVDEWD